MAGIDLGGGAGGGRKSVDSELNMVPMIDLLMCLICFLLITAVWSTMTRLGMRGDVPGQGDEITVPSEPKLHVTIEGERFVLTWRQDKTVVSSVEVPMSRVVRGEGRQATTSYPELAAAIEREWRAQGSHRDPGDPRADVAIVHCDDRAPYGQIVAVIDAVYRTQRTFPGGGKTAAPAMWVTFATGG
jgi:biopolymer transport protein ExbD